MNNKHQSLPEHELLTHKSFIRNLNLFDWAFALLIAVGAFIAQTQAGLHMDIYEMVILWASAGIAVFLGWFSNRCAGLSLLACAWRIWPLICMVATSNTQTASCSNTC